MATVAILEIETSKVSCRLDSVQSYEVLSILKHFEIFEIFDICDGSYGNRDHSQNLMAYTTLVHGRDHTIKVSIHLTYHIKKVNATLRFLDHFDLFCIVSMETVDILEIPTPNSTSTKVAHRYARISKNLEHFHIFEIFGVVSMAT